MKLQSSLITDQGLSFDSKPSDKLTTTRNVYFEVKDISYRDCCRKFVTGIFVHNSGAVNPKVKSQARGQNNWSRALK